MSAGVIWLSVALIAALIALLANLVVSLNAWHSEAEWHASRRHVDEDREDVAQTHQSALDERLVNELQRDIDKLHARLTALTLKRVTTSIGTTRTSRRTPATASPISGSRSAANFEQQRAYAIEFQSEVDRIAQNSSRVNVDVHDAALAVNIDVDARASQLRDGSLRWPSALELNERAPWITPRASLCGLDSNDSHVQEDMRRIPHIDPTVQAAQFNEHVTALQFPPRCDHARLLLYSHWHDIGLGSELHWIQVALTAAFMMNRTLVIREDQGWLWVDRESCGERTFSCLFEPLSSCEAVGRDALERLVAPQTLAQVPVVSPATMTSEHTDARVVQWENAGGLAREVPQPFRYDWPRPVFWWRAQLCRFIFRPRAYVLAYVEARRRAIFGTLVAVPRATLHIRAGDKTHGNGIQVREMEHATVDHAIARLNFVHSLCAFEVAFISTRDPQSLRLLQQRAPSLRYRLVFDAAQVRYGDGFHTLDLVAGHLNRTQEALQYIKDVVLLADTEYFIGAMESNVARIVAELSSAHDRLAGPPVTLLNGTYIVWP